MMMSIIVVAAAFSTDFARMYVVRAQLQTAADAAAMAAVAAQGDNVGATSYDTGKVYLYAHPAAGRANIDSSIASVSVGSWINGTTFVADPDQTWDRGTNSAAAAGGAPRDAVQIIARDTVEFTFGKILGYTKRVVTAQAVGVWGSSSSSTCIRPWAVPYQSLLDALFGAGVKDPSYVLTPTDINNLHDLTTLVQLKVGPENNGSGGGSYTANSQFWIVQLPPQEYANGNPGTPWQGSNNYGTALQASCDALASMIAAQSGGNPRVSIDDWLSPETGAKQGDTKQGIDALCGGDTCDPRYPIAVALWDTFGPSPHNYCGSTGCYHVKYLANFSIDNISGKTVSGVFNTMTLPGNFGGSITPGGTSSLMIRGLVK
jgi:hypothetical protein